jgi:DNA helicase-2/ATP-dependent DNA helicase PcrA
MQLPPRFKPNAIEPSDEQVAIQMSIAETIIIQANAGAAKTTTLALQIAQALTNGTDPSEILALTYTQPACAALRSALSKIGVSPSRLLGLKIQTFDQFATEILFRIEKKRSPFKSTPEEVAPVVWQAIHKLNVSVDGGIVERFLNAAKKIKGTLALDLARWDGQTMSEDLAESLCVDQSLLGLFRTYEAIRYPKREGVDLPFFRCEFDATYDLALILADPEPTTYLDEILGWPRSLRMLLIDEMHDLNFAMYTIVRTLLKSNRARFCGVGDHDQVIHAVAGAEQRFMHKDIDLHGRKITTYELTSTHRFGRALSILSGRLARKKYASAALHSTQVDCHFYSPKGKGCEALLVESAQQWKKTSSGRMDQFAILLRHSWQSIAIENALVEAGIFYETKGFTSYVLQPEVLLIRALLAVASGNYEQLNSVETRSELVRSVVFFCDINIDFNEAESETQEQRVRETIKYVAQDKELLSAFMEYQVLTKTKPVLARRMEKAIAIARNPHATSTWFDDFLDALDVKSWVLDVFVERQRREDAWSYLQGLKRAAAAYVSPQAFFDSLGAQETRLKSSMYLQKSESNKAHVRKTTLTVAKIPDVKGLEFDHVVIPYLEHGVFPASGSQSAQEERNLLYVGMTRARQGLTLLAHSERPSEFIESIGLGQVQNETCR